MSDFDTVLERLVTDPAFPAALAADPATALAGYRLSAEEVELLCSQVSAGTGGDRTVETRTSKAGVVGLLASLHGFGTGAGSGHEVAVGRTVPDGPHQHFGANATAGLAPVDRGGEAPHGMSGAGDQVASDYHARVDADGDGRWDRYLAVRHADGGVDVYEDRNGDGRIDFVGHDANGDGVLESADYDNDFDGVTDIHMTDTNGDGWMDTQTRPHTGR